MRKLTVLFALLALVPFAFAACGDDDEDTTAEETTEETTETTTEADTGGGGETVPIAADPGGQLAFGTTKLTASAGPTTFEFENPASIPHDFCLENSGDLGCTDTITESSATLEADLESGEYTYYCSVAGHREAGMEGTLTVK